MTSVEQQAFQEGFQIAFQKIASEDKQAGALMQLMRRGIGRFGGALRGLGSGEGAGIGARIGAGMNRMFPSKTTMTSSVKPIWQSKFRVVTPPEGEPRNGLIPPEQIQEIMQRVGRPQSPGWGKDASTKQALTPLGATAKAAPFMTSAEQQAFQEGFQQTFRKLASQWRSPETAFISGAAGSPIGAGLHGIGGDNGKNQFYKALKMGLLLGGGGAIVGSSVGRAFGEAEGNMAAEEMLKDIRPVRDAMGKMNPKYNPNVMEDLQRRILPQMIARKELRRTSEGLGMGGSIGFMGGSGIGSMQAAREHNDHWPQKLLHKFATTKQALTPLGAAAKAAPFVDKELAGLGEKLWLGSHKSTGIIDGLRSTLLPGYGQLRNVHNLKNMYGPVSPQQMDEAFTAIGATARPRINFLNRAVPAAGALAIGGGYLGMKGREHGRTEGMSNLAGTMQQLPLMERLKYLISPQQYMNPAIHQGMDDDN